MFLGLNQGIFEYADIPIEESLRKIAKYGFKYIDYSTKKSSDPTTMSKSRRKEVIEIFRGEQFICSQLLMLETKDLATADRKRSREVFDYMRRCAEFQIEIGGKHVLICWGAGIRQFGMSKEEAWRNSVSMIRKFCQWAQTLNVVASIEMDPHVYFVVNDLSAMVRIIEEVEMPNLFANIDIGHLHISREEPMRMEKLGRKILHAHLSDTDSFNHTNDILGTGIVNFDSYIDKLLQIGIEENCRRINEPCVATIEIGSRGRVDDPDRWIRESLSHIRLTVPELQMK